MPLAQIDIAFPSVGAGSTDEVYAAVPFRCRPVAAYWAPATAAAANATNYATITLASNDGAGGSYTSLGTLTTATVAMAVDTSRSLSMSGAGQAIPIGGMIKVAKTEAGTGAIIHGTMSVLVEKAPEP